MHVEHFMTRDPVACDVGATLAEVAGLMADKGVGCVIVLRGGKVAGLVTDRQLAVEGIAEELTPNTTIDAIMTRNPATLTLDDNLFSAVDTMRSAGMARRVPVVNAQNELLGIVSLSDIAVIAQDLVDHILQEEIHHARREAHLLTGGKRIEEAIRHPTQSQPSRDREIRPITAPTPVARSHVGSAVRHEPEERFVRGSGWTETREAGPERGHRTHQEGWLDRFFGTRTERR